MLPEDLDRALGATPPSFSRKMDQTLHCLKEEKNMKRFAFRTVLVYVLITLLLGTTAFALVSHSLAGYYSSRFTAYQEHEPERYEAIMTHLQTEVPQVPANDPEISITVAETSWSPEQHMLVVSILAAPLDPDAAVLHPLWNLDADGAYVGKGNLGLFPDDEEAREEHWLWTKDGFGPVTDMIPADKQLLLLNADSVYLDDIQLLGDMSSMDAYVTDDGTVHTVLEIRLEEYFDPSYANRIEEQIVASPDLADFLNKKLVEVERFRQIMAGDEDGVITLTVPYTVTTYTDDDTQLYRGGREGTLHFDLKIR